MRASQLMGGWLVAALMLVATAVQAKVPIEEIESGQLKAWLAPYDAVPVVSVMLSFKNAGAVADPKGKEGLAYLAAQMLMKGTAKHNEMAFHEALEARAIGLDTSASRDVMNVSLSTLRDEWPHARALMIDMLREPQIAQDKLDELKQQMIVKLKQSEESPYYLANRRWQTLAYGEHPYARPLMGTPETIAAITRDDIAQFLKERLTQDRLIISIAGALDRRQVKEFLADDLIALPEKAPETAPIADAVIEPNGRWSEEEAKLPQSVVMFGRQGVARHDPDFYAAYVLNDIVGGGGLTSRLAKRVREQAGLTYDISSDLDSGEHGAAWIGLFATADHQVSKALEMVNAELEKASTGDITQSELDASLGYITGSFALQLTSNTKLVNYLNVMQLYELGMDYLDKRNGYFKAVTLDQVNQMARKLLNPKQMVVVKVGPAAAK